MILRTLAKGKKSSAALTQTHRAQGLMKQMRTLCTKEQKKSHTDDEFVRKKEKKN